MINILVVDDEKGITDVLVEVINMIDGVQGHGALDSKEAKIIIDKLHPELIIVDYTLNEGVVGPEIFKYAKQNDPHVKAILMTGNADDLVEQQCHEVGIKKIIEKPIRPRDFKELMEMIAEKLKMAKE